MDTDRELLLAVAEQIQVITKHGLLDVRERLALLHRQLLEISVLVGSMFPSDAKVLLEYLDMLAHPLQGVYVQTPSGADFFTDLKEIGEYGLSAVDVRLLSAELLLSLSGNLCISGILPSPFATSCWEPLRSSVMLYRP